MSRELIPLRGRCYLARRAGIADPKPFLVVSGNRRNQALTSVLAVRVTTSPKPALASVVELGAADPLVGRALCDEVGLLFRDEITADLGAVTPATMRTVERGLHAALGLAR